MKEKNTRSVGLIGESGLLELFKSRFSRLDTTVLLGIGDDCALVRPGHSEHQQQLGPVYHGLLISTDTLVEGRHFLGSAAPADVGWKLVATACSDLAAMGEMPRYIVLSFTFPAETTLDWIEGLVTGVNEFCNEFATTVVGGNTTCGKELNLTATVFGSATVSPLRRSGAKVGDDVWVTGSLGGAQLGLELAKRALDTSALIDSGAQVSMRYMRPIPRFEFGTILGRLGVHAMIDVSDGLILDLRRLVEASALSVECDISRIPLEPSFTSSMDLRRRVELLAAGGDYELLFTAPSNLRENIQRVVADNVKATRIGMVISDSSNPDVHLLTPSGRLSSREIEGTLINGIGFDHFKP